MRRPAWLALTAVVLLTAAVSAHASDDFRDMGVIAGAVNQALESRRTGTTSDWSNDATGNSGSITITRTYYEPDGTPCRDYTRTTRRTGTPDVVVDGTGCRGVNAVWKLTEKTVETVPPPPPKKAEKPRRQPTPSTQQPAEPEGWRDPAAAKPDTPAETTQVPPDLNPPPREEPAAAKPPPAPRKKPIVLTGSVPSRSDD